MVEQITLPEKLADYRPSGRTYLQTGKYVLFGIDSDGCVDAGMRYKHGGPFPRAGIEAFGLQPIAEPWRIAWSYVNEFSKRGCPRFEALAAVVDLVITMPIVQEAQKLGVVKVPELKYLKDYNEKIAKIQGWGDNVLDAYMKNIIGIADKQTEWAELLKVQTWSRMVNKYVSSDCPEIPQFDAALASIRLAHTQGVDQIIVSGTPEQHLRETWKQHGLLEYVLGIFGRESGKKNDHFVAAMRAAKAEYGRMYDLAFMFGDAPEDDNNRKKASEDLGVEIRFVPIRVGFEEQDWKWFKENFLEHGKITEYTKKIEAERIKEFLANLNRPFDPTADITRLFTR